MHAQFEPSIKRALKLILDNNNNKKMLWVFTEN